MVQIPAVTDHMLNCPWQDTEPVSTGLAEPGMAAANPWRINGGMKGQCKVLSVPLKVLKKCYRSTVHPSTVRKAEETKALDIF